MTYIDLILERNDNKQKHLLNHYYFNFQAFLTVFLFRVVFLFLCSIFYFQFFYVGFIFLMFFSSQFYGVFNVRVLLFFKRFNK